MKDERLKTLLATVSAMDAPPVEMTPRAKSIIDAALSKLAAPERTLSESEMISVILKVLSRGRSDGGEIVDALAGLRVCLADKGDGLVFALLARMQESRLVEGKFDAAMTRKTYQITDKGAALLERTSSTVRVLTESLSGLWAT